MNGFELLKLSQEIVNCKDDFERGCLARKLIIKMGGKIDSTYKFYFEDEHGRYICTESGRKIYAK